MASLEFRAMNTRVMAVAMDNENAMAGLEEARDFVAAAERRFSRFIPESELCQLNGSAGSWASVSSELMEILTLARRYYDETQGLFDPSVLPELLRAGYDRSLDQITGSADSAGTAEMSLPDLPNREPHRRMNYRPAFSEVAFDATGERVRLPVGMAVDLGGIAKGWIVEQAAKLLAAFSAPCGVSAGGDMFFVGEPDTGLGWQVEVEDPRDPDRTVAWLRAGPGAVVTSSVTKRVWTKDGANNHHIIDPRSGDPAKTPWLSATVFAPEAAAAEAYAKALLIGGRAEAERLLARVDAMEFVSVDEDGGLFWSPNFKDLVDDRSTIRNYSK